MLCLRHQVGGDILRVRQDVVDGMEVNGVKGRWISNGDAWNGSLGTYGAGSSSDTFYLRGVGLDWYNIYMHRYMGPDEYGLPQYLHRVTEQDVTDNKYPGKKKGDGVLTNDYALSDFWEVGSAIPDIIGGFNTTLTWKNWVLSANFAFQIGGKFYSHEYVQNLYNGTSNQGKGGRLVSKDLVGNTWTPELSSPAPPPTEPTGSAPISVASPHPISGSRT